MFLMSIMILILSLDSVISKLVSIEFTTLFQNVTNSECGAGYNQILLVEYYLRILTVLSTTLGLGEIHLSTASSLMLVYSFSEEVRFNS